MPIVKLLEVKAHRHPKEESDPVGIFEFEPMQQEFEAKRAELEHLAPGSPEEEKAVADFWAEHDSARDSIETAVNGYPVAKQLVSDAYVLLRRLTGQLSELSCLDDEDSEELERIMREKEALK